MRSILALLCLTAYGVHASSKNDAPWRGKHCQRGESCWPSERDVQNLEKALDPRMPRLLEIGTSGYTSPYLTPIAGLPAEDQGQPLYGLGLQQMKPVYVRTNLSSTCADRRTFDTDFCKAQITNMYADVEVDFVVFPLTVKHVQASLAFAKKHRLCISVAGTGHEFQGRNQPFECDGGSIIIKTSLLKSKENDFDDAAGLGHPSFRFGSGNVFSELHYYAASQNKIIASGICPTVGIIGWSLGGGHGVFGPRLGLGSDQLLAVDIVLASGEHVRASELTHSDLFTALRGGGGSTWGIITHVVVKAYDIPEDGFTMTVGVAASSITNVDYIANWVNRTVMQSAVATANCTLMSAFINNNGAFQSVARCLSPGGPDSEEAQKFSDMLADAGSLSTTQFALSNSYEVSMYNISNGPMSPWPSQGSVNTVLLQKEDLPDLVSYVTSMLANCDGYCIGAWEGTITGHIGSPQPTSYRSLNHALRTGVGMLMTYASQEELDDTFGERMAYFSESNYQLPMSRYWDLNMYKKLLRTKNRYDPKGIFGCRRCVGDDTYFSV